MDDSDNWAGRLIPPRRNRFFYGKMMGVAQFEREQRYEMSQRWLINRLTVGSGILCGLGFKGAGSNKLRLDTGAAIDGLGREIVVARPFDVDLGKAPAPCGCGAGSGPPKAPGTYFACLAYHECAADQLAVAHADNCAGANECEADSIVETFTVEFVKHEEPQPTFDCDGPEGWLTPLPGTAGPPTASDIERKLVAMLRSRGCAAVPAEPCVILGTVTLEGTADALTIKSATSAGRRYIYSQTELLDMILCLAKRLGECCQDHPTPTPTPTPTTTPIPTATPTPTPTPTPTATATPTPTPTATPTATPTPSPTPPPPAPIRIEVIEYLKGTNPIRKLQQVLTPETFKTSEEMSGFRVTLNQRVDHGTTAGGTVVLKLLPGGGTSPFTGGMVTPVAGNIYQYTLGAFPRGDYEVTLVGTPTTTLKPILSMPPNVQRLDGEPRVGAPGNLALPSGEGHAEGDFVFRFSID